MVEYIGEPRSSKDIWIHKEDARIFFMALNFMWGDWLKGKDFDTPYNKHLAEKRSESIEM